MKIKIPPVCKIWNNNKKQFIDKIKAYSLTKRASKIRKHFIKLMLPTLLVRIHSIAYLWVGVIGCNHEFGYHLTDIHLTERHFVVSSLRPDHTAIWISCRKWQQLPCVPPTSPHCDHDNQAPPQHVFSSWSLQPHYWAKSEKGTLLSYSKYAPKPNNF